jgi:hypothetical protein
MTDRKQSLDDLDLTIKKMYFVTGNELSDSLTILGVCYEIAGDKTEAYRCYNTALQNEHCICRTAAKRRENLKMR